MIATCVHSPPFTAAVDEGTSWHVKDDETLAYSPTDPFTCDPPSQHPAPVPSHMSITAQPRSPIDAT